MKTFIAPRVHLNGDTKATLQIGIYDSVRAVEIAIDSLCRIFPHGRNYFGADQYGQARAEHEDRIIRLQSVRDELLALYQALDTNSKTAEVKEREK